MRRHTKCALVNGIQTCAHPILSFHDIPNPQASVDYNGTKLALALFLRSPQRASGGTILNSSSRSSGSGSASHTHGHVVEFDDDPGHDQHEITRWFGQHNLLLLCPVGIHRMDADGPFRAIFSARSEGRRDGKECVSTCRYRWQAY